MSFGSRAHECEQYREDMMAEEHADRATVAAFIARIHAMPADALAGFADDVTAMVARGEVSQDFGIWAEVALERLDKMASEPL
jgi:hypothetical protein